MPPQPLDHDPGDRRDGSDTPPPALAWTALALSGDPCSARELVHRFADDGARISRRRAEELLDELQVRGLVRVVGRDAANGDARFARTILGDHLTGASVTAGGVLNERLRELERLRGDLLATVAHELRTPLTSIRTSVGLLLDPSTRATDRQRRTLLEAIERSASRLQQHADDVLDLTRFRSGNIRLGLRRFDARTVVDEVSATLSPTVEAKHQRIEVTRPDSPVWIFADRRRLERALLNLASNAHKFSPEGEVIRIAVEREAEDLVLSVEDHGPGITTDQREKLFERFFVGAAGGSQTGSGLGLPIALAIAQAHGGHIDVESTPGTGSTFRLVLPAAGPGDYQP